MKSGFTRRISGVAFAGALAFGAGTTNAAPASAHYSQCPEGYYCQWSDSSFNGAFGKTKVNVPNFGAMNDSVTSFWNRTDDWVTLYLHTSFTGGCLRVAPGASTVALNQHLNDSYSSLQIGYHNPAPLGCFEQR